LAAGLHPVPDPLGELKRSLRPSSRNRGLTTMERGREGRGGKRRGLEISGKEGNGKEGRRREKGRPP